MENIIKKSCVKIYNDNKLIGTGFFVTASKIITASHLFEDDNSVFKVINKDIDEKFKFNMIKLNKELDFAIIEFKKNISTNVVPIGRFLNNHDECFIYGFSSENNNGDSVTVKCEGIATHDNNKLFKFKDGIIKKGLSGSPVLNKKSNKVIGLTILSRDTKYPLGGYALGFDEILKHFNMLLKENRQSIDVKHVHNVEGDLSKYDSTRILGSKHYNLYSSDIKIEEIYIEPLFKILVLENGEPIQSISSSNFIEKATEILLEQKILFLTGPYGSGKSILSKHLQYNLFLDGKDTIYLSSTNLRDIIADFEKLVYDRKIKNKDLYVFIDSVDEIDSVLKNSKSIYDNLLRKLFRIINEDGIYIILNYRSIPKNKETNLILSMYAQEINNVSKLMFISIDYFDKSRINSWLANYSNYYRENNKYKNSIPELTQVQLAMKLTTLWRFKLTMC